MCRGGDESKIDEVKIMMNGAYITRFVARRGGFFQAVRIYGISVRSKL